MLMRLATVAPKPSKRFASQLFMLELARTGSRVSSCIRPCGEANKLNTFRQSPDDCGARWSSHPPGQSQSPECGARFVSVLSTNKAGRTVACLTLYNDSMDHDLTISCTSSRFGARSKSLADVEGPRIRSRRLRCA